MDPDAMTTLLGDAICNIEEEDYWEACQHALKSPYEARTTDDEDEEGENPLVMMMKVVTTRVIVVVTVDIVGTITAVIVIVTIAVVKTMIANIVAMIRENPLVIERMKM